MTELLWWKDPRAATLPGYLWAVAEIQRCESLLQDVSQATVRVEYGRVVAIGNIVDDGTEN